MSYSSSLFIFFLSILSFVKSDILCSACKFNITSEHLLDNRESSVSMSSSLKSVYYKRDVLLHTFKNPQNVFFQVITFKDAHLSCDEESFEEHTFFPGYSWSGCVCPNCGSHIGWKFRTIKEQCIMNENEKECKNKSPFYGLIRDRMKHKIDDEMEDGIKIEL